MTFKRKLVSVFIAILTAYLLTCIAFFLFQEKLIFHPQPLSEDYRFSYQEPFEELMIPTLDGKKINALLFKAQNSKGVVLYFHGNAGNLSQWGRVAPEFLSLNYDLFILDYRGFGKSTGSISEYNLNQDAHTCYHYLLEHGYNSNTIIVYGRSIGTGVASRLAREVWPKAVILESPLSNMTDLANHYAPFLPNRLLLRYKFPVFQHLNGIKIPAYIIHGDQDEIIPYELAKKLKKAKGEVNFFTIHGGNHNNLIEFPQFHKILREILP